MSYRPGMSMKRFVQDAATSDHAAPGGTSANTAQDKVLRYLIARLVTGEPVSLGDEPIRTYLGLPADAATNPDKYLPIVLQALGPAPLMTCPKCQSKLKDVPGVTNERCPFCGHEVGSEA